jgi:hypothetical protein
MSIVKLLYFDSRLCCEWKCLKTIPYYVFQAMSYLKTLKIDSRLYIPCYVDSEISTFSIPDYVLKTSKARFQTMYSMLCRVWNREKSFSGSRLCIPCYVDGEISSFLIPGYVVLKISEPQFQTMYSMLCRVWNLFPIPDYVFHAIDIVKSPIFRFQTMSNFRFHAIVFQPDYGMASRCASDHCKYR